MAVENRPALFEDRRVSPEDLCGLIPIEKYREIQLHDLRFYIDEITDSLENYIDEIPIEIIHSDSHNPNHKVRRGWVAGNLCIVTSPPLIEIFDSNPLLAGKIDVYRRYYTGPCFERHTRKQDIDRWNRLLTIAKTYLSGVRQNLIEEVSIPSAA